jgi:hypothetical protein
MNSEALATEIKAKVQSKNAEFSAKIEDQLDWLFSAVAEAVIEHISTNMIVTGSTAQGCTAGGATGTSTSTLIS